MKKSTRTMNVVGVFFLLVMSVAGLANADDDTIVRKYDVSQDGNTFKVIALNDPFGGPFDTLTDEGHPSQGAVFSVLGYFYPKGTLQGGTVSGTNADGSPAFPELVLGQWSCRGWFILDGNPGISGIQLLGQQVFLFNSPGPAGRKSIVTEGIDLSLEAIDLNVPIKRVVFGGTGPFRGARGQQTMTNFPGFNDSFGVQSTHRLVFSVLDDDDSDSDSDSDSD